MWRSLPLTRLSLMVADAPFMGALFSPPCNRRRKVHCSPQVGCLSFQEDAVGLVVKDHVANIAAIEAGAGGADAAGQEGVHGGGLVGAGDVHRGRGQ